MKLPRLPWRIAVLTLCTFGFSLQAAESAPAATPDDHKNGYTVTVQVKVSAKGEPENVKVVSSDDPNVGDVLTKMAVAMAMKLKLPPRAKNGAPAEYTARVPFFFPIEDDEGAAANDLPKPKLKEAVQPVYPLDLRDRGEVGGVVLELVVDAEGKLTRLTTLRASHPEFEAAAVEAVKKWTFAPAQKDGKPVESRSRLAIVFENETSMADLKWRIPPRPSLGSFTVVRPNHPLPDPDAPGAPATSTTPANPAAPAGGGK